MPNHPIFHWFRIEMAALPILLASAFCAGVTIAQPIENLDLSENKSKRPTQSAAAPPTSNPRWDVTLMNRTVIPIGQNGGGILLNAKLTTYFESGVHMGLALSPLVTAQTNETSFTTGQVLWQAGVENDPASASFGLGIQGGTNALSPVGVIHLRLGGRDHTHLALRAGFSLLRNNGLVLSEGSLRAQFEFNKNIWITPAVEASTAGYALAEVGVRIRVSGSHLVNSTFLILSGGVTSLYSLYGHDTSKPHRRLGGLHLGMGLEFR